MATGYYDHPNYMNVPGESLPKVFHYFKEAHPYFDKDVCVIGGKNSSVDAALELVKAGARVTVLYRGKEYSPSIKPWILPEFESLVKNEIITMEFQANVNEITENQVIYMKDGVLKTIQNDFVFAMTGYHPDHEFLLKMGIGIDDETADPFTTPTQWKRISVGFLLLVLLRLVIMQMKFLLKMVAFMAVRLHNLY